MRICFVSKNGRCITSKGPELPKIKKKEKLCILLEKPSKEEVSSVCKAFKFQKKHFLDYTNEERSMRYSMTPLVFVFLDYFTENNEIKQMHVLFAMKQDVLLVITPQKSKFHRELFDDLVMRLENDQKRKNPLAYFLYYFLYEDARENYDVIDELEDKVMFIEENVQRSDVKPKLIEEIIKLKRKCFKMSKHLWASAKLIFTIKRGLTPLVLDKELFILLDDVYDTFIHQIDLLTVQREILTDLLEIYATIINNKLTTISNELSSVMKKLTSITVIIAVPTLIASFYGMNFKYMPELSSPYGYVGATTAMLILSTLIYFYFHKKQWI